MYTYIFKKRKNFFNYEKIVDFFHFKQLMFYFSNCKGFGKRLDEPSGVQYNP